MSYLNSVTTPLQQVAHVSPRITAKSSLKAKTMNIALWTLQALWGVFFCFTGFGKIMCYRPDVWNHTLHQPVAWFSAIPQGLFVFIGVCEFLGGVGLILPAMTGVKPKLTPFAAIGLTLIMILAAIFHIVRGEYSFFVPMNLALAGVAAFIANDGDSDLGGEIGGWAIKGNGGGRITSESPLGFLAETLLQ